MSIEDAFMLDSATPGVMMAGELPEFLRDLSGRRITVVYNTKDNRTRILNGSVAYDNISDTLATISMSSTKQYRSVILNRISEVRADGKKYRIV